MSSFYTSVRTIFQNKTNFKRKQCLLLAIETVSLAEWIIDDTCLVSKIFFFLEIFLFRTLLIYILRNFKEKKHVSSMIPWARPIVPPLAIIIFKQCLFCDILKSVDGRTDVWAETYAKILIATFRDCGLAEWIKYILK